jgi:hypothetical protein
MPPEAVSTASELAIQWPVVAIVVGVFVICGLFALKIFREYHAAQKETAALNRVWQSEETALNRAVQKDREKSWQDFMADQGLQNRTMINELAKTISEMRTDMDKGFTDVMAALSIHDALVDKRVDAAANAKRGIR